VIAEANASEKLDELLRSDSETVDDKVSSLIETGLAPSSRIISAVIKTHLHFWQEYRLGSDFSFDESLEPNL
jgi:hypothetical protein